MSVGSFVPSEEPQHAVKENGASGIVDELRHLWRRCDSRSVLAQPPARLPVPWRSVRPDGGDEARRDIRRTLQAFPQVCDEDSGAQGDDGLPGLPGRLRNRHCGLRRSRRRTRRQPRWSDCTGEFEGAPGEFRQKQQRPMTV